MDDLDPEIEASQEEFRARLANQRLDAATRRRFIYDDIEGLLLDGFLHCPVDLDGTVITFRTIPTCEYTRLRMRCESAKMRGDVLRWVLASSVWMVDGYDISGDVNAAYHMYREFFLNMRHEFLTALSCITTQLRARVDRAVNLIEAYCYEPYSRSMWRLQGRPTAGIGMNVVRRIWVAHNLSEDDHVSDLRTWEHTRAQVGSMSGKGAKQISRELDRLRHREEDRRQKHIQTTLNKILYGEDWDGKVKVKINVGGTEYVVDHITAASSFDELDDQMRRMIAGQKDAHDLVVEEYMGRIQAQAAQRKAEYEAKLAEIRAQVDYAPGASSTISLVGYTAEQLAELGMQTQNLNVREDGSNSAIADHLFDKIVNNDIKAGWISTTQMPEAWGQDSGGTTLQEKIAARKPSLEALK